MRKCVQPTHSERGSSFALEALQLKHQSPGESATEEQMHARVHTTHPLILSGSVPDTCGHEEIVYTRKD